MSSGLWAAQFRTRRILGFLLAEELHGHWVRQRTAIADLGNSRGELQGVRVDWLHNRAAAMQQLHMPQVDWGTVTEAMIPLGSAAQGAMLSDLHVILK